MRTFGALFLIALGQGAYSTEEEQFLELSPKWEYVSDQVMGGVSHGSLDLREVDGQQHAQLKGQVSLENNGGFVQMAFDLALDQRGLDVSGWRGLELTLRGNNETYDVRLRTVQLTRPWQSFRTQVQADTDWKTIRLPFLAFEAHRTDVPFDPTALRRIGILAIGRPFTADVTVARVGFYR